MTTTTGVLIAVLYQWLFFATAHSVPQNRIPCTLCPVGEKVNEANRSVVVNFGPSTGLVTRTCGDLERLLPLIEGDCPTISDLVQFDCACLPALEERNPFPIDEATVDNLLVREHEVLSGSVSTSRIVEKLCGCQPSEYNFKLLFSAGCPPNNDAFGPEGVHDQTCRVYGNSSDIAFAKINTVFISEFDRDGSQVNQKAFHGPHNDGDAFVYQSIMMIDPGRPEPPRLIGVALQGNNSKGIAVYAHLVR